MSAVPVRLAHRGVALEGLTMAAPDGAKHVPWWVPVFNAVARRLLAAGVKLGPDVLITIPGRKTGLLRTTPVTLCEDAGRRGVISPFGEVHWVRNLRAAGRATISLGRSREELTAIELGPEEAAGFIRDVLAPQARRSPLGAWFVRAVDKIDIDRPEQAVTGRPVFELHPLAGSAVPSGGVHTGLSSGGRRHKSGPGGSTRST